MTRLLDDAIARVRRLPDTDQDDIASWLLMFVDAPSAASRLSDEQLEEVRRRLDEYRAGRTAPVDEGTVSDLWARCGL
jgi:hypothetical protein